MKRPARLLSVLSLPLRLFSPPRAAGGRALPRWAERARTGAAGGGAECEADFRDRALLPLLRAETLDRFEPPASWAPALADEARACIEETLRLAWEGPARMTDRPPGAWGRAYDLTAKEGSRDPFLVWMSVVGQKRWHWDDRARDQLSGLERDLAARPPEEEPFRRLLAAHARQLLDPSEAHARALCAAAVRWAEAHAARPERTEAVLRALAQFVDIGAPALVPAFLRSSADPWIAFALGGEAALGRARTARSLVAAPTERAAARDAALRLAAASFRRAWRLRPESPQGAAGMAAVCGMRGDRRGLRRWLARGAAARFDFPPLHARYALFLRRIGGGSAAAELRAHAEACLAAGRADSMLPWCAAAARLAELGASGLAPAAFFAGDGPGSPLERRLAEFLERANGTGDALSESAELLACLRWTRGDLDGARAAVDRCLNGCFRCFLQGFFPDSFDILETLFGLSGPNAARIRPLRERLLAGDAEGLLARWEEAFAACEAPTRAEKELLERLAVRAFLAARFPRGEPRRVPVAPHGEFSCWYDYGLGWQPEVDDAGGYVWHTGRQRVGCLEFGLPLPTPIEIGTAFEPGPDPAAPALFAIRLLPADLRFSDPEGASPVVSVRAAPDGALRLRLGPSGDPCVDLGYTRGTIAEAHAESAESKPHAESAEFAESYGRARSPSAPPPRRIPLRVIFLADRVLCYLGDSAVPALDAPCADFAPAALPDGAKLVFFGINCRFFGFTFRKPQPPAPGEGGTAP